MPESRNKGISIGVITLPGLFNYGNRLQCYAVCAIYRKLGCSPVVLERRESEAKRLVKRLLGRERRSREELMDPRRLARFESFNALMPQEKVSRPYCLLSHRYSFFSVGSDQTWNPEWVTKDAGWYFLRFAHRRQRIALAPSIGVDEVDKGGFKVIGSGVRGFANLSIREQRGAELIYECSKRDASVLCDPTLVLTAEEWRSVSDGSLTPSEPYVFSYVLGNGVKGSNDVLRRLTRNGNMQTLAITDGSGDGEPPAGPAEFISLIDNAEHVVTDSFHAAVFASILQTPLTVVRREGGTSMFSRLEQLSKMLGIEHKIYGTPCFDLSRAADYEGVPELIEVERNKFISYLKACLNV